MRNVPLIVRSGQAESHCVGLSPLGLTAMMAAWHVALLGGRASACLHHPGPAAVLASSLPGGDRVESRVAAGRVPSRPVHSYYAGQLALTVGMAVVSLASWLHIMRISGALGY